MPPEMSQGLRADIISEVIKLITTPGIHSYRWFEVIIRFLYNFLNAHQRHYPLTPPLVRSTANIACYLKLSF